jgi:hypothetical protein
LRAQLNYLRAALHPVSKQRLPEARWMDGSVMCTPSYARRCGKIVVDDGFAKYEPAVLPKPMPQTEAGGKTAEEKRHFMQTKIRLRQRANKRSARAERRKQRDIEVSDLIADFVGDLQHDELDENRRVVVTPDAAGDEADAEFWKQLIPGGTVTCLDHIEEPKRMSVNAKRSAPTRAGRLQQLASSCKAEQFGAKQHGAR